MLTVSVHHIRLHAFCGLYEEEQRTGNRFETDVDLRLAQSSDDEWPMMDYVEIGNAVRECFEGRHRLIEEVLQKIYARLRAQFPKPVVIRIAIRKMDPPIGCAADYSQVCFEE